MLLFGGISAALWNGLLLADGAFAARNAEELLVLFDRYTAWATGALVVAVVLGAGYWLYRRRAGKRK